MIPADTQDMGAYVSASEGSSVTFHCKLLDPSRCCTTVTDPSTDKYNDTSAQYDQTVSLDGTVVSRLSTSTSLRFPIDCDHH